MLEYHLSLHEQFLWFVKTSFILSHLHKRGKWMSMQNKPEHQYKIKLFKGCLCSVSAPEDLDYCKKKHLLHDLVFVSSSGLWFAAMGNKTGLSLWNSDIPFLFFPLLSFPDFTSPPDIRDTILQLQLDLRVVWAHTINFLKTNWAHCLMTKQLHLSNLQRTPMFLPKKMHTFRFWKY